MRRAWWAQSPTATIWEATLARGAGAPEVARRELASRLDGALDANRTRELLLLAGELVSNSVLHAGPDGSPEILLELVLGRERCAWWSPTGAPPRCRRSNHRPCSAKAAAGSTWSRA
jgi:hypothetical protein